MWFSQKTGKVAYTPQQLDDVMGNMDDGILDQLISEASRGVGGHPGLGQNVEPLLRRVQASNLHVDDLAAADSLLLKYRKLVGGETQINSFREYSAILRKHKDAGGITPSELKLTNEQWAVVNKLHHGDWAINAQMNVIATQRAFNAVIPFIDDHKLRSQFQQWVGNYIPFWFAQEQFMKRWARTLIDSPESIRRMQLAYGGMVQSGVIIKDPERGDPIFVMPGSAAATEVIASVAEKLFGIEARIPISMPLTGKVMYTVPGLDRLGVPSVGPTVAIPLGMMAQRFPELQGMHKTVTGQEARRGALEQLYPASLRRFTDVILWDPDGSKHAAHAIRAAQYLEMNGDGLGADASVGEQEKYFERVQNWTRSLALTEAIVGFMAPASPSGGSIITGTDGFDLQTNLGLNVDEINDIPRPRFLELLGAGFSWEEAVATFMKENVDATPHDVFRDPSSFTVFATKGTTGRQLPTSSDTFDWMINNEELLTRYTKAAAWLIPHGKRDDDYEWKSYNEQLAMGLREHKTLDMFYDDIKFAAAMPVWRGLADEHTLNLERIELMDSNDRIGARPTENDRWRQENRSFQQMHPTWARIFEAGEGRSRRREILTEWAEIGQDPTYERSERFTVLNGLFEMYQLFQAQKDQLTGRRGNEVQAFRQNLEERFMVASLYYVEQNPEAREFWNSVIKPEVS